MIVRPTRRRTSSPGKSPNLPTLQALSPSLNARSVWRSSKHSRVTLARLPVPKIPEGTTCRCSMRAHPQPTMGVRHALLKEEPRRQGSDIAGSPLRPRSGSVQGRRVRGPEVAGRWEVAAIARG
jgi:hypothetical protein